MGKKTVIRRMSKRWDLLPEIRDAIYADDDTPEAIDIPPAFTKPIFSAPAAIAAPEPVPVPAEHADPGDRDGLASEYFPDHEEIPPHLQK